MYFIQFVHNIAIFMSLHGPAGACIPVASASPIISNTMVASASPIISNTTCT